MSRLEGEPAALDPALHDATSVLLLADSTDPCGDETCVELLSARPSTSTDVLCVSVTTSPDDRLGTWRAHAEMAPSKVGFVAVGDELRSASAGTAPAGSSTGPDRPAIELVSSPGDLTSLGIGMSGFLSAWADDGNRTVVCVHSLTTLLQYTGLDRTFRFLHVLSGRLETAEATGHWHLDPAAHDERTVNTLKTLFDAVITCEDGERVVESR